MSARPAIGDAPLRFAPLYRQALWGGQRIAEHYGRREAPPVCSESWEISAHPDGVSRVLDGALAGQTLADLTSRYGRALLGRAAPAADRFPLLFKLIDAQDRLSIQVHPGDTRPLHGGEEAKTEMWHLLAASPGATLYAGLADGCDAELLRAALRSGHAAGLLRRHDATADTSLFIPGGLVHAIGAGCLIYEVQQSSNTTYRLYDWERRGADGQPRTLHLEDALRVIDWQLPVPRLQAATPLPHPPPNRWFLVQTCSYFKILRAELATAESLRPDGASFHALFVVSGAVEVATKNAAVTLTAGGSCLIPASAPVYAIHPADGAASVLLTTLVD